MVKKPIYEELEQRVKELEQTESERKRAEGALQKSEALLQAAMNQSQAGIAIADAPDGKLRYVNDSGLIIRGKSREEIVDGIGIDKYVASWQILHFDGTPYKDEEVPLARAIMYGEVCSEEFIVRRKDEEDRIVLANAAPILDDKGRIFAGIVVFLDITERVIAEEALEKAHEELEMRVEERTVELSKANEVLSVEIAERKQAEGAMRESEERFRSLFEQAAEAVFVHDLGGHIKDVNHVACEIWGYDKSEFLDLCIEDIDPDASERDDKEIFWDQLEEKAPIVFEARNRRKDGSLFPVEVSLSPIQFGGQRLVLGMVRDISERKQAEKEKARLEAHLHQATKMEAIATLAGGVAHEFNNALMGIVGNIELLRMDLPEDERRGKYLEAMKSAGYRMSRLTDQLLAYAQGGKYQPNNPADRRDENQMRDTP